MTDQIEDYGNGLTIARVDGYRVVHVDGKPTRIGFCIKWCSYCRMSSTIGGWVEGRCGWDTSEEAVNALVEEGFVEQVRAARAAGSNEFEMREKAVPTWEEKAAFPVPADERKALEARTRKRKVVETRTLWPGHDRTDTYYAVTVDGIDTGLSYTKDGNWWQLYARDIDGKRVEVKGWSAGRIQTGIDGLISSGAISRIIAKREAQQVAA